MAVGLPLGSNYSGAPDCKYVALITAAYLISINSKNPDNDLPTKPINDLWLDTMFFFYGSVGSEITNDPHMLNVAIKWRSFIIIVVGLIARFFANLTSTYLSTLIFPPSIQTFLTLKERVYLALAWSAKAAGQGALAYQYL